MPGQDTTKTDLARRAVACKGFRWMPGMRSLQRGLLVQIDEVTGDHETWFDELGAVLIWSGDLDEDPLPDLDDPGTLGCIEHGLLPALYGQTYHLWCGPGHPGGTWGYGYRSTQITGGHPTKDEALVCALEAAPS